MRVIKVKPFERPVVLDIEEGYASIKKEIDGMVGQIPYLSEGAIALFNEEFMIEDLPPNVEIEGNEICGNILIVGDGDECWCGLTDEQITYYMQILENKVRTLQDSLLGELNGDELNLARELVESADEDTNPTIKKTSMFNRSEEENPHIK